jgi:hypothetical protein
MSKSGGCLCGGVTYVLNGRLRAVVACHCSQCRKTSGHYVAATQSLVSDIEIRAKSLVWYRSSTETERGFCGTCGSNLFWRRSSTPYISIHAGTIDPPTGLKMETQLYASDKSDYYELPDCQTIDQEQL